MDVVAVGDDGDLVVGAEGLEGLEGGLAGHLDFFARHGAGLVDDDGEVHGRALEGVGLSVAGDTDLEDDGAGIGGGEDGVVGGGFEGVGRRGGLGLGLVEQGGEGEGGEGEGEGVDGFHVLRDGLGCFASLAAGGTEVRWRLFERAALKQSRDRELSSGRKKGVRELSWMGRGCA